MGNVVGIIERIGKSFTSFNHSYSIHKLGKSGNFIEVNDPILSRIDEFINRSGKVVYDYYEDQREKSTNFLVEELSCLSQADTSIKRFY